MVRLALTLSLLALVATGCAGHSSIQTAAPGTVDTERAALRADGTVRVVRADRVGPTDAFCETTQRHLERYDRSGRIVQVSEQRVRCGVVEEEVLYRVSSDGVVVTISHDLDRDGRFDASASRRASGLAGARLASRQVD